MSVAVERLRPPSRTLMFLEGRAIHELGAFVGALPLLSLAPRGDGHPELVLPGLVASDTSISLVGWSLGGLYARQLAKMMPDRVRSVITLGSPFACNPKATNAWRVYEMASGHRAAEEDGRFGGSLAETPPVPTTAIFSRTDGICAWQGCMEQPSARSENIEVESS